MASQEILIGSDHAALDMKDYLIQKLQQDGVSVKDMGTNSEAPVDYPDIAHPLAQLISDRSYELGILICGTGIGMAITANKHQDVRAAVCPDTTMASLAREHNDANIVCLPGRFISKETAYEIVSTFLNTPFAGGRHNARVDKIENYNT